MPQRRRRLLAACQTSRVLYLVIHIPKSRRMITIVQAASAQLAHTRKLLSDTWVLDHLTLNQRVQGSKRASNASTVCFQLLDGPHGSHSGLITPPHYNDREI